MSAPSGRKTRAQAARLLAPIILDKGAANFGDHRGEDSALIKELCYGCLRLYPRLKLILDQLLEKPLKPRDADIQALLILGLYQLYHMRIPDHAVLDETVGATLVLKKKWAKGLVNAVLRNALRKKEALESSLAKVPEFNTSHPEWLVKALDEAWPEYRDEIYDAGNDRPPMVLRVNEKLSSVADYLEKLAAEDISAQALSSTSAGVRLKSPVSVNSLPGFHEGLCSVQDEAAQWTAALLQANAGDRVLDACAAPGGKTCHLLEYSPGINLTALEIDAKRAALIEENLQRLNLDANVICADAGNAEPWWDKQPFDRILVDAPCSGTGVIRRHPDIKLLRRPSDIEKFAAQQRRLLDNLWPLLAQDGLLLYVTCSIMPTENESQIQAFLACHPDAQPENIVQDHALRLKIGLQSLPSQSGSDGFYFALLRKS